MLKALGEQGKIHLRAAIDEAGAEDPRFPGRRGFGLDHGDRSFDAGEVKRVPA